MSFTTTFLTAAIAELIYPVAIIILLLTLVALLAYLVWDMARRKKPNSKPQ